MAESESRKAWTKANTYQFGTKLQNSTDADIIAFLSGKTRQQVIKTAIRYYIAHEDEVNKWVAEMAGKDSTMKVYGRPLTQKDLDIMATYMDDEIREAVHAELAPCKPEEFLRRYLELDPDFIELLTSEFNFTED